MPEQFPQARAGFHRRQSTGYRVFISAPCAIRVIVWHLILLITCAGAARAGGEWRGGDDPFIDEEPALYAKGCYWRGGVRHCSNYCYQEINGKRYCHVRESVAFPQGDPYAQERPTVEEIYRRPRPHR